MICRENYAGKLNVYIVMIAFENIIRNIKPEINNINCYLSRKYFKIHELDR